MLFAQMKTKMKIKKRKKMKKMKIMKVVLCHFSDHLEAIGWSLVLLFIFQGWLSIELEESDSSTTEIEFDNR
jgi:hypothetical protein